MRDIAELRQAMARRTADLAPRAGAEEILRAGRRRAHRRTVGAAAASVGLAAMAVPVVVWATGGGEGADSMVGGAPPATSPTGITLESVTPAGISPLPTHSLIVPPDKTTDPRGAGCPADPGNAAAIGDPIWTGTTNSKGQEIVVRFLRSDGGGTGTAGFGVGIGDPATRTVEDLGCSFGFPLPLDPETYVHHGTEFDGPVFSGPDSTTTIIDSFVGPAARITATYDGEPLPVRMGRWSAHPDLVVYWIAEVPAGAAENPRDDTHPLVTIFDAAGNVIGPPR